MIYQLYKGKYELEFSPAAHRYKVNGEYKEGVTSIINKVVSKDHLISWSANMAAQSFYNAIKSANGVLLGEELENALEGAKKAHTAKKNKGADTGSAVHEWIENYIGQKETIPAHEAEPSIEAFMKWEKKFAPEYIKTEQPIYSEKFDYCGTFDCLAKVEGKLTMIDFKTSNPRMVYRGGKPTGHFNFYPEHMIQCAAYDQAYGEETGKHAEQYMIVYITKQGHLHTYRLEDTEQAKAAWACAISLARYYKELEQMY